MSEFNDKVEQAIAKTADALADGFDASDVSVLVREAVEVAEGLDSLDGPAKRKLAIEFAGTLVDKFFTEATPQIEQLVKDVDWPFLTDGMEAALVDPIVKKFAVPYARDLLKLAIPSMVDLVVDASKGFVNVNVSDDA
jgi:hypothetical protein